MSRKKEKHRDSDDEDDDIFYYRFCASSSSSSSSSKNPTQAQAQAQAQAQPKPKDGGGETLAPSKSTVYVSNLDYTLTNSDLHTLFSTFGKIARVTVLKDRVTRLSRGVAFVQFVSRHDAQRAASEMHRKVLNGRTLTASIAADNGRAPEFIRKRVYNTDTARCFECGAQGHLSYDCPRNLLGPRPRPPPKRPRGGGRGRGGGFRRCREDEDEEEDRGGIRSEERFEEDNWASVVDDGADERLLGRNGSDEVLDNKKKKKKGKKVGYFSDESDHDDDDD